MSATHFAHSRSRVDSKTFSTWGARAALVGIELLRSYDDHGREVFICSKWAMTKEFQTPEQVEDFLKRAGAPK